MDRAKTRGLYKAIRTMLQLIAGGALTALVSALADLNPAVQGIVLGGWTVVVAGVQNYLETAEKIPVLLPTPPLDPPSGFGPSVYGGPV